MLDSALFFLWPDNMLNYTFAGDEKPHQGARSHERMVHETRDGYICTMPVQRREWEGVFKALELPNLFEDERFRTQASLDSGLFRRTLDEGYASFDTDDLAPRLERHEVPFAIINPRDAVIDDPQVKAMEALLEFEHPVAGPMRQARPPARFGKTPVGDLPLFPGTRRAYPRRCWAKRAIRTTQSPISEHAKSSAERRPGRSDTGDHNAPIGRTVAPTRPGSSREPLQHHHPGDDERHAD